MMQPWKLAAVLGLCVAATACGPAPLAQVRTWDELRAQRVYRTADAWQVQLGWGDSGPAGGPWVVVYATARYVGKAASPPWKVHVCEGDPLGPLTVRVHWNHLACASDSERGRLLERRDGTYCQSVPLTWPGTYTVEVCQAGGQVLAGKRFTVAQTSVCYWHDFAEADQTGAHFTVLAEARAVYPALRGIRPLAEPDRSLPLAGYMDSSWLTLDGSLDLELRDGCFVVSAPLPIMEWPDWCLMARWWVNGKPVPAARAPGPGWLAGRAIAPATEMTVAFGFPDSLGVKIGDKVALQVMYAPEFECLDAEGPLPQGTRPDPVHDRGGLESSDTLDAPALSNPIEFVVTADLLKLRAANQTAITGH